MMELKSICKSFGENEVLRDISMIIPKGGRVLITAPSGRGKTTLLRIMMGLETPDSGEVLGRPGAVRLRCSRRIGCRRNSRP